MKKIIVFCTTYETYRSFLIKHIFELNKKYQVVLVTKFDQNLNFYKNLKIKAININIKRNVNFFYDFFLIFKIFLILLKEKPDMILSLTPKAGFFGMLIAFLCRVKIRLHIFTGQVWANKKKGIYRYLLIFFDKLLAYFSTHLLTDGVGQKKFLLKNKITNKNKIHTIYNGSICGVDTKKFKLSFKRKIIIRKRLQIDKNSIVLMYAGRINYEKGVLKLVNIFLSIIKRFNFNIFLLIVGNDEARLSPVIKQNLSNYINKFKILTHRNDIYKYFQAADIFCLPSEREGFGMSAIQASSCSLPVVCSDIYGLDNTVIHKKTGLKSKLNNDINMYKNLLSLIKNKKTRKNYGMNGRKYVLRVFDDRIIIPLYNNFFNSILNDKKSI